MFYFKFMQAIQFILWLLVFSSKLNCGSLIFFLKYFLVIIINIIIIDPTGVLMELSEGCDL